MYIKHTQKINLIQFKSVILSLQYTFLNIMIQHTHMTKQLN